MTRRRRDGGFTLFLSILVIVLLLGLGVGAIYVTTMGTRIAGSLDARQAALNAANAGIQHGRQIMTNYSNASTSWNIPLQGQGNAKDQLPTTANPKGVGAIMYDGATPLSNLRFPNVTCAVSTDCFAGESCVNSLCSGLGNYTVWVRNDPVDINLAAKNSTSMEIDTNTTVILRSVGTDPSGAATVAVEAAVYQFSNGTVNTPPNQTFGKGVDQYGSGSTTGSVAW